MEILQFLEDFNCIKGIDVCGSCAILEASAISPHLLEHLALNHIMELTGLLEGHALTMQLFSKVWAASLNEQHQLDTYN
jgi:predicted Zn-dependent protease with MMP-like domain